MNLIYGEEKRIKKELIRNENGSIEMSE
jgi:hypothetical protein